MVSSFSFCVEIFDHRNIFIVALVQDFTFQTYNCKWQKLVKFMKLEPPEFGVIYSTCNTVSSGHVRSQLNLN